jgi:molecular chaperone GrpE
MEDDLIKTESESIDEKQSDLQDVEGVPEQTVETDSQAESTVDETAVLRDQLLRALAEFENYKKRTVKEYQSVVQLANEKLIIDLLPAIDDLERALKAARDIHSDDPKVQQSFQGFENIYKKLMKILEDKGLKPMESIGKEMDVNLHDALMQVEGNGQPPNTVVDEHEKGYYLHDKVIRHAKVIVTK